MCSPRHAASPLRARRPEYSVTTEGWIWSTVGFEAVHSRQQCVDLIEDYAALGGDGGVTEDVMRLSCGMRTRNRTDDTVPGMAALTMATSQPEDAPEGAVQPQDPGCELAAFIMQRCLDEARDSVSIGWFKYVRGLPPSTPNIDRASLWEELKTKGHMIPVVKKKGKGDSVNPNHKHWRVFRFLS